MTGEHPITAAGALDDRLAIVGTAGSGKTYAATGAVEQLLAGAARVILIDPLDVTWGLRLRADGEPSNWPVVIFGGAHGDLPLAEGSGAILGEAVAGMAESCIVSLGGLGTKAAERRFMLAFLTALYAHASGEPVHLVIDEADMFAPQTVSEKEGGATALLGMMETIVRRGRVKGFIPWLITQRPAVLNKNVLSMADGLIAMKLTSSQDRAAIGGWIEGQADREDGKRILSQLPTMMRGQGVVWIPGRGVLRVAVFPEKATFDSSRTPRRGETVRHATLRPLDVSRLRDALRRLESADGAEKPAKRGKASPDDLAAAEARGFERGLIEGEKRGHVAGQALALTRARLAIDALGVKHEIPEADGEPARTNPLPEEGRARAPAPIPEFAGGAEKLLRAIRGAPLIRDWNEVAILACMSPTAGYFRGARKALLEQGAVRIDDVGVAAVNFAGLMPLARGEVVAAWASKLGGAAARMLRQVDLAADETTVAEVNDALGLSHTAGYTRTGWKALRANNLIVENAGRIRLATILRSLPR